MSHPSWKRWVAGSVLLAAGLWGVALLTMPGAPARAGVGAPQAGQPAPDFTLEGAGGQAVSLSALRGRPVVLNFWATWCQPCRAEMPDLEAAYRTLQDRGLVVAGVNIRETRVAVAAFRDRYGLTFPLALDAAGEVARLYGVVPLPTTVFIDRQGVVRAVVKGQLDSARMRQYLAEIL